jgi:hypothetical protein
VPDAPDVIVIQVSLRVAVHAQPAVVFTEKLPVEVPLEAFNRDDDSTNEQPVS